jgi:hypothetical protein
LHWDEVGQKFSGAEDRRAELFESVTVFAAQLQNQRSSPLDAQDRVHHADRLPADVDLRSGLPYVVFVDPQDGRKDIDRPLHAGVVDVLNDATIDGGLPGERGVEDCLPKVQTSRAFLHGRLVAEEVNVLAGERAFGSKRLDSRKVQIRPDVDGLAAH